MLHFLLAILLSLPSFGASSAIQTAVGANPLPVANGGTGLAASGAAGTSFTMVSGSPAWAANPGARYYASSTALSGSLATIVWTTSDWDTHSAMSSGVFTCPVVGKYQVNVYLAVSGTFILNNTISLELQRNSTAVATKTEYVGGAITNGDIGISDIVNCSATSDTIRVQVSSSATGPAIVSSNVKNWISIQKVD